MSFWSAQRHSMRVSRLCVLLFFLMTVTVGFLVELILRRGFPDLYSNQLPLALILFVAVVFLISSIHLLQLYWKGGAFVAQLLGGHPIADIEETEKIRVLRNVLDEMFIASGLQQKPEVFILPYQEINAFVAGLNPSKSALGITQGAINLCERDELAAIIAHELGHLANKDTVLNTLLGSYIAGFTFLFAFGIRALFYYRPRRHKNQSKETFILFILLIVVLAGALSWLLGKILQSLVSQNREYLADSMSAQFTRSPISLIRALRKIAHQKETDLPIQGSAFSHLYLHDNQHWLAKLFSSHPPIEKRIEALEKQAYIP